MRNLVTEVEEEPAPELGEIHITCCIVLPFLLTSYHPEKYQLVPKQKNMFWQCLEVIVCFGTFLLIQIKAFLLEV